jgi:acetolactate synthase-1/2/3 large subunit
VHTWAVKWSHAEQKACLTNSPPAQALWSQAREGARVLTVVCANSAYAILKVEAARQGAPAPAARAPAPLAALAAAPPASASSQAQAAPGPAGPRAAPASQALTSLAGPALDWVSLAAGMGVPGGRARTAGELAALVGEGLRREGPFLIEAVLP